MLSGILSLLGILPKAFGTIDNITNAISNERIRKISAHTEEEKILADERINALQVKRDVLIAESGTSRINAIIRGTLGASVSVLVAKLLVWDKVIGAFYKCAGAAGREMMGCETFRTDPIADNQWAVVTAAIGFYFLYEGAVNVTRIAKS